MPALESRISVQVQQLVPWTIALHPSRAWATMVYGTPDVDRLWGEMRQFLRLDAPDPQRAWRDRLSELRSRAEQLNDLELDAVRFHGPGTDLTIGLIPQAHWATAELQSVDGRMFQAVLPTEEVYITPDHRRVEGMVRSTRPLSLGGTVVRDLELTFRDGRVSNVSASTGAEAVRASQATDAGAARLGELALVDRTSPISRSASVFTETGLDENAACHLAWGAGLWSSIPRARSRTADELRGLGVNSSGVHIDFMVGAPDVTVTGILPDGGTIVLLENETWQL
jgi:aminopeptidase